MFVILCVTVDWNHLQSNKVAERGGQLVKGEVFFIPPSLPGVLLFVSPLRLLQTASLCAHEF